MILNLLMTGLMVLGTATRTDTTISVRSGTRLELKNFGGSIKVSGWDRSEVRLVAEHGAGTRIVVKAGPAGLVLRPTAELGVVVPTPTSSGRSRVRVERVQIPTNADFRISVPRWMGLRLSGLNSDVTVDGVDAEVTAETVSGDIGLRGGKGNIRLAAMSGDVEAVGSRGRLEVSSTSGGVRIRDVEGEIRIEAVSGDIELDRVSSSAVQASTVSGNVLYDGTILVGGSYRLASHSGDLIVHLPDDPDVRVSVDTFSGDFDSSFPVRVQELERGKRFTFFLGKGQADLSLDSFSGTIHLLRAREARSATERARRRAEEARREAEKARERLEAEREKRDR
jgi:hypothetical protein